MSDHAIIITWRDMEGRVLPHFIARANLKYKGNLHLLYFDNASINQELKSVVATIGKNDRLKIFISGHGDTGMHYIGDNSHTRRKSVDDLVDMLKNALMQRDTSKAASALTQVNMVSCLFGRTSDGSATSTPAAKLHEGLATAGVFVDLVARTESIMAMPEGRTTLSELSGKISIPVHGSPKSFIIPKAAYTKMLYTYFDNARVIKMAAYDPSDTFIETSTLDGRRILWADYAVTQLVDTLQLKHGGLRKQEPLDVIDEREKVFVQILTRYDTRRNPEELKQSLQTLVDGDGHQTSTNFNLHRNFFSKVFSSALPKKSVLINELLTMYPT
ncbi:hypothetical protein ACVBEF_18680 [Glaciimonas sp. GG7]